MHELGLHVGFLFMVHTDMVGVCIRKSQVLQTFFFLVNEVKKAALEPS